MHFVFYFILLGLNLFLWQVYDLPLEPIVYIIILCTVFLIIVEGMHWIKLTAARKEIQRQLKMEGLDIAHLPVLNEKLSEDYKELLEQQEEKYHTLESLSINQLFNMKQYYGILVHQMKTPISGISLLISEEEIDRRAVKRELFRIEQYVNAILWYQRFQEGNHDLLIQKYSAEDIVKHAVKRNSVLLLREGLHVELDLWECVILTDKKWLGFILDQLLGNAAKYTKEGMIRVEIKELEEATEISINDTGIGIREEDLKRIFEWGYTGYNGHENRKSTGIGLALCKRAAELLGHKILVNSKIGEGTSMTIHIDKSNINFRD